MKTRKLFPVVQEVQYLQLLLSVPHQMPKRNLFPILGDQIMLTFKECTLAKLDKKFGLKQTRDCPTLEAWLNQEAEISDFERQVLQQFREVLILNVHDWNEVELSQHFIGPVFTLVNFTTYNFNIFSQRSFSGTVNGIELGGRPDGMIASGIREPETPYFCFQEYKRHKDPEGDPAAQALAAMLVAQEINEHKHPIYGAHVIGPHWYFQFLQDKKYCISHSYVATRDDLFDIFLILKALKEIIIQLAK